MASGIVCPTALQTVGVQALAGDMLRSWARS